ncbi:MAG: aromatic amino acid lyase [Candidatus Coatesbacteria bacterium]|nr:aromatic amino acid lyase [Candidatus Coatesbacteria bacterium]
MIRDDKESGHRKPSETAGQHPVLYVMDRPVENPVIIDHRPNSLTFEKLVAVARGDDEGRLAQVVVSEESLRRTERSAAVIQKAVVRAQNEFASAPPQQRHLFLIYGVNTGFGVNRDKPIESYADCCKLSENILFSHATGVGPPLASEVVRATMLLRLRTFAQGRSGVRRELLILLAEMLNRKIHPFMPSQGSVGSSGDLCSLSHLSLVLIGHGKAWVEPDYPAPRPHTWDDTIDARRGLMSGREALQAVGLEPLAPPEVPNGSVAKGTRLGPKEGLALTNGATVATAMAALAAHDAGRLLAAANLVGAMTLQAMSGTTRAFEPCVHDARRHEGQKAVAQQIMRLLVNPDPSGLDNRAAVTFQMQDDYCLRAIPQVHGAALAAIWHAREVIEGEMNAVTDNPLVFCEPEDRPHETYDQRVGRPVSLWPVYSAANFHGEPIGLVADYLKLAVSELASISERRAQMLLDDNRNRGLPSNLSGGRSGLDSGFMIFQYTAASLVSENKVLCHPASCDSIPTSSDAEDHVAMATTAARHLRMVILNLANVLAIEFICATQALAFRTGKRDLQLALTGASGPLPSRSCEHTSGDALSVSKPCNAALEQVSSVSPFVADDADFAGLSPHFRIESVRDLIMSGTLPRIAVEGLDQRP